MKNKIILLTIITTLFITSCSSFFENKAKSDNKNLQISLDINLGSNATDRKILPDYTLYEKFFYEVKVFKTGETEAIKTVTPDAYDTVLSTTYDLEFGSTYSFEVNAYNARTDGTKILTGKTDNVEIVRNIPSVVVKMHTVAGLKGTLVIPYDLSDYSSYTYKVFAVEDYLLNNENGTNLVTDENWVKKSFNSETKTFVDYISGDNNPYNGADLEEGEYYVFIYGVTDGGDSRLCNSALISIKVGLTTEVPATRSWHADNDKILCRMHTNGGFIDGSILKDKGIIYDSYSDTYEIYITASNCKYGNLEDGYYGVFPDSDDTNLYFTGWFLDKSLTIHEPDNLSLLAGVVDFYAGWQNKNALIKLHLNGGNITSDSKLHPYYNANTDTYDMNAFLKDVEPITYYYDEYTNEEIRKFDLPVAKSNSVFTGWYTDDACSTLCDYNMTTDSDDVIELYAGWKAKEDFKVIYSYDTGSHIMETLGYTNDYKNVNASSEYVATTFTVSPDNTIYYTKTVYEGDLYYSIYKNNAASFKNDTLLYQTKEPAYAFLSCPTDDRLFILERRTSINPGYTDLYLNIINPNDSSEYFYFQGSKSLVSISDLGCENDIGFTVDAVNKRVYVAYTTKNRVSDESCIWTPVINIFEYSESAPEQGTTGVTITVTIDTANAATYTMPATENYRSASTDMIVDSDGNVYMTMAYYSDNDCIPRGDIIHTLPYFYHYGELYKVNYNPAAESKINVSSVISFDKDGHKLTGKNYIGNSGYLRTMDTYTPSSANDVSALFCPKKILAITAKKLVMTDSGVFVYVAHGGEDPVLAVRGVSRIVEIDLTDPLAAYISSIEVSDFEFAELDNFSNFFGFNN